MRVITPDDAPAQSISRNAAAEQLLACIDARYVWDLSRRSRGDLSSFSLIHDALGHEGMIQIRRCSGRAKNPLTACRLL